MHRQLHKRYRALTLLGVMSFTLATCGGSPTAPSSATPTLVSPVNGGYVQQNDPSNGCAYDPYYGHGFRVAFAWTTVAGASAYRLEMQHQNASVPILNEVVRGKTYEFRACSKVAGFDDGWQWRVRAIAADGHEGNWSEPRFLNFLPCRLNDGYGCTEQR